MFAPSELIRFPKHLNNSVKGLLDGEPQGPGGGSAPWKSTRPQAHLPAIQMGVSGQIPGALCTLRRAVSTEGE